MNAMNPITRIVKHDYGVWAESHFDTTPILWAAEKLYAEGITKEDVLFALKQINDERERQCVPCAHFGHGHELF